MRNSTGFRRLTFVAGLAGVSLLACTETPGDKTTAPRLGGPSFAPGSNPSANLDQWANGHPPPTSESWQNGNLNGNNSAYAEGRAVPFRLALEGLSGGSTHFITIQYDFTAGGHKAYDYLASIEATEPHALDFICAGTGPGGRSSLCGTSLTGMPGPGTVSTSEFPFPVDGFTVDNLTVSGAQTDGVVPRFLRIFGGTITSISTVTHVGCTAGAGTNNSCDGNSTGEMLVSFTVDQNRTAVQLVWSGHLGKSSYWNSDNPPDGASQVSGAPWHMRTLNLDGGGAANQDRSIQPSAIVQVDAKISIGTSGVNEVGVHHAMTGHVDVNTGSGFVNAPDGTIISFAIASGPGIIVVDNVSTTPLNPAQCTTSGGTGSCTVYLYSTTAGLTTVNASTSVSVGGTTLSRTTNGTAPNSGPLTKQWVDAQIDLSPLTATNVLGQQHVITALVQQDDGLAAGAQGGDAVSGFGPAAGKTVTFSLLNNTAGATFTTPAPFTCVTDANGQCTITITAANAGAVDIHATTTFTVGGVSLTRSTGTGGLNSADAHKNYTSGGLAWTKVDGNGIALGGATFQYRIQGGQWIPVVDNQAPDADNTAGSFLISGLAIGTYEVKETAPPLNTYNIDPSTKTASITAQSPNATITVAFVNPQPKAKIVLDPLTATNVLGEEHVVNVTVSQDDGLAAGANGGDAVTGYTASVGRTVTFSLLNNTAGASFKNAVNTCVTDATGKCSITIQSTQAGSVNIHATTTFTLGTVSLTVSTDGLGDNSVDAQKTWSAGSIAWTKVKGDGVTKLGGAVFEYQVAGSGNWIEVTDNSAPDADPDNGEFQILNLSIGTYEVREKTAPTGYIKDPNTYQVSVTAAQPNGSVATAFVDPAPKAKIELTPLTATNEVNSAHTITATVSQDDGLAAGLGGDNTNGYVASAGRTVNFSLLNNTAGATFVGGVSSCVTNSSGQCTVQINSSTPGSVDIHATTTFSIGGISLTATTNTGGDNSADANKRYVDAQIDLSPLTATNVLGEQHTVTATVQQDDGRAAGAPGDAATGFGPAPSGVTVTFSLLNNTAGASFVGGANTCTTNASGVCSVVIQSTQVGGVDIHATTTFSVGGVSLTRATGTGGLNSADARKDWQAGSLAWYKNDGNGARLGGATFQYRLSPNGAWITVTDNQAPDADPDAGEFLINGLGVGTYDVKETQAPSGYTLDGSTKQATITHDAPNAVISVAFVNTTFTRGLILPTQTTCQDFAFGNPTPEPGLFAGIKQGKINNVSPGVVFYYTEVIAPAASFTIGITQTNNKQPFPDLLVQQGNQITLYNADCTIRANGISATGGTATISVTGATVGAKYIVGVKYDTSSPVGQSQSKLDVTYTFGTTLNAAVLNSNTANIVLSKR
jgi:hypothetical protein